MEISEPESESHLISDISLSAESLQKRVSAKFDVKS